MQAEIFRSDFEAERRDREQAHGRMEAEKSYMLDEIETLQSTIQQKSRELQRKDQQLATLRGERGMSIGQSSQQMADLQEELETARAQIRGYKTKADLLKKDLEEEKVKCSEETRHRVGIQEERDFLQGQVSNNSMVIYVLQQVFAPYLYA